MNNCELQQRDNQSPLKSELLLVSLRVSIILILFLVSQMAVAQGFPDDSQPYPVECGSPSINLGDTGKGTGKFCTDGRVLASFSSRLTAEIARRMANQYQLCPPSECHPMVGKTAEELAEKDCQKKFDDEALCQKVEKGDKETVGCIAGCESQHVGLCSVAPCQPTSSASVEEVWDRSADGNIDEERWIVRCGCCCETTATPPANVVMKCEACNEWDPISEIEDRLKDPNHGLPPGLVDTYKTLLTLNKYAQSIYGWF